MKKTMLLTVWLLLSAFSVRAQRESASFPAASSTSSAMAPVTQVTLGNATMALTGPWKFHIGDNMAWAQPGFDDSGWGTMDLTPPPGSYDPTLGSSGYVPGWTARGYQGYHGYAWYRLRVNIRNGQTALTLKMPDDFDDAYQVYVNGEMIGQFGHFTTHGVTFYNVEPRAFPLPAVAAATRGGPVTIAVRMWMSADTSLIDPDAGGLHGPPVLGQVGAIVALLQVDWDAINRSDYSVFFEMAILLLALLVALSLFGLDRREPAYLWLGLTCAVILAYVAVSVLSVYSTWIDGIAVNLLMDVVLGTAAIGLWVIFWATWFRLTGIGRIHRIVWSLVVLLGIGMAMLRAPLYGRLVPVHAIVWLTPMTLALKLLLGVLLIWVAVRGIRKDKAEGWLALPAVVLVAISQNSSELLVLHVPVYFQLVGIPVSIGRMGTVLSLIIITVLLLRRFLQGQREREQWRLEIEQARQVQQMLIPETLPVIPGFTLESEYRPAQQVGGDFFQIIPDKTDGSVLIVVGDVTGHGLQAGMLVALIVGAIRSTSEMNADPMFVLNALNRRLCGRGHAHATCLAMRIEADGAVTLANAGHLPPYLNGKELPMEGAMILGMVENAEFSQMKFQLQENDRLILLSDGVVEAQNANGKLFGFERIHALLQRPITAAEVATIAQNFGQQDDISVLSVMRTEVREVVFA